MKRQDPPPLNGWSIAGIVLASVVAICGLALFALVIVVYVGMSSYGSNK